MYLDFHSKDSTLPDYSTRIISQGGATNGQGALNMYASTMGIMATNGVGIGTTVPTSNFHVASGLTSDLGNGLKTKYTNIGVTAASVVSLNTVNNGVFSGSGPYTFTTNSSSLSGFFAIASGLMIGAVYQISVTCNSSNVTSITISDNLAVTYMTIPISSSSTTYTTPGYATTNASLYIIITTPTPAVGLALTFSNITVQRIDTAATGFVGIGVTLPNQTLHVKNGTGRIHVECDSNLGNAVFQCTTRNVGTSVSNTSYMFTDLNGTLQIYSDSSVTGYKNVVISNNNLFGVGTTLPYFTQSVEYYGNNATNFGINLHNTYVAGATNVRNMIVFTDVNSTQGAIGAYRVAHDYHYLGGLCFMVGSQPTGYNQGRPTTQTQVRNSLTEAMRITPEGYIGIGTATPAGALDVVGSSSISTPAYFYLRNNGGGQTGSSDTVFAQLQIGGTFGPWIRATQRGNGYTDSIRLDLCTNNASNDATVVPRISVMPISGYVGIGITNPSFPLHIIGNGSSSVNYTGSYYLQPLPTSGQAGATGSGSLNGNIIGIFSYYAIVSAVSINTVYFSSYSDVRIKKNIQPIQYSALPLIEQFRIVSYDHIDKRNKPCGAGVIGQEIEAIFPSCIEKDAKVVPNIYERGIHTLEEDIICIRLIDQDGQTIIKTDADILTSKKISLRVVKSDKKEHVLECDLLETDGAVFKVKKWDDYTADDLIFVYGTEVSDFLTVDKNMLSMLGLKGIQELASQIQELASQATSQASLVQELAGQTAQLTTSQSAISQTVQELSEKATSSASQITQLAAENTQLKSAIAALEARLAALEAK
jgi:hypothetical protein